jgi:hypothetical protein
VESDAPSRRSNHPDLNVADAFRANSDDAPLPRDLIPRLIELEEEPGADVLDVSRLDHFAVFKPYAETRDETPAAPLLPSSRRSGESSTTRGSRLQLQRSCKSPCLDGGANSRTPRLRGTLRAQTAGNVL